MRGRHVGLLAAVAAVAGFAACTLNPQPLPPRDDFSGESSFADGGASSDSGGFSTSPQVPGPEDAASGTPNLDADGGSDAGDAGDDGSSDAGDASDADGG